MNQMITTDSVDDSAIAIVGISGRFPQAVSYTHLRAHET